VTNQVPQNGQIVTFTIVPAGSYLGAGEDYRVDRPQNKGDFRFVSVERGSSAYARTWMMARAEWRLA